LFKKYFSKGLFITGTDTGVGKTMITALLGKAFKDKGLNIGVLKPIATGCVKIGDELVSEDAVFLKEYIGLKSSLEEICPIKYELPVSPLAAQMETQKEFNSRSIFEHLKKMEQKYEFIFVEGIGGLMVPLKHKYYVLDLIKEIRYPVIIVAKPNLGTLNHTLLTILQLKAKEIDIIGMIINHSQECSDDVSVKTNIKILEQETGVKVLGVVPYMKNINKDTLVEFINPIIVNLERSFK
jgi:dethiobiotin synthetase